MKLIWVLVNCNTTKEACAIGDAALKARLAACYDIFPRLLARYFWPPKRNHVEQSKGCLLALETLPKQYRAIGRLVKKLHSDTLPFIGSLEIKNVPPEYLAWLRREIVRKS